MEVKFSFFDQNEAECWYKAFSWRPLKLAANDLFLSWQELLKRATVPYTSSISVV